MADKNFYLSWVDKRTDPWPQWEDPAGLQAKGVRFLPADHPEWPGIPWLQQAGPVQVSDPRMGRSWWPGIPYSFEGSDGRLYTGPTLSALFHPASSFHKLRDLERVFLLFQPDLEDSPHELLEKVLRQLFQARGLKDHKLQLVPIPGIGDPTDHDQIVAKIRCWLENHDPFDFDGRQRGGKTITVNLSPGTPAMHACWLMLHWSGALDRPQDTIRFVQGDGGLHGDLNKDPLRIVSLDVLTGPSGEAKPANQERPEVGLDELGPPYDQLRRRIDRAAFLGLPILLHGKRGTGKTFLAHYYHQRRKFYKQRAGTRQGCKSASGWIEKPSLRYPENASTDNFVPVILSEYPSLDELRGMLFGWKADCYTNVKGSSEGLLGRAHGGTLFLDEIHHLDRTLQAALLGPMNNGRYRPKMADYEIVSDFDLVVASNDPHWRLKLSDDFRDRIERVVLEVPSFKEVQRSGTAGLNNLWKFWEWVLRDRCAECAVVLPTGGPPEECRGEILGILKSNPLAGNWRDLQRLADNLLLHLTYPRDDGRPSPLRWDIKQVELAIHETFADL